MGKYDNYSNSKNIAKAQRKYDRLCRKRYPDPYKLALAKEALDKQKLFESCQIFKTFHGYAPNENVMFSDDNKVMWFFDHIIRYEDIKSYCIAVKLVTKSHTVTSSPGVVTGAILGHAIAGDIGAVVGALSADSQSTTTYYQEGNGFIFQIFTKDGLRYYCELPSIHDFTNEIHPLWVELGGKIQRIIDGKN